MSVTHIPSALRQLVFQRARGCCEYCLIPSVATFASHEIDHIVAEKHGGLTVANNLALSCALCNKHKGSDLTSIDPETRAIIALFNPRIDKWTDHFVLKEAQIVPLTPSARVTVSLLRLNLPERINERVLLIHAGHLG